jgi:hypothetical protein
MSYTLQTATTAVRNNLNEDNAAFWSDTEIQTWIKEGVLIFSSATLMIESTETLNLTQNQLSYDYTDEPWIATCMEIYAGIYNDGVNGYSGLIKAHPRMLGHLDTFAPGPTKYICLHDRKLYIWPLPTAAVGALTVSILHSVVTDDITAMEDEYQIWPIIYGTAKAKEKDRREAEAGAMLSQFYTMVNFERQDKHAREVDSMDKFLIPEGGQGPEGSKG